MWGDFFSLLSPYTLINEHELMDTSWTDKTILTYNLCLVLFYFAFYFKLYSSTNEY